MIDISKDGVKGRSPCGKVLREYFPKPIALFRVLVGYHPSKKSDRKLLRRASVCRIRHDGSEVADNSLVYA